MKKYLSFVMLILLFNGCNSPVNDNEATGIAVSKIESEDADAGLPSMNESNIDPTIVISPQPQAVIGKSDQLLPGITGIDSTVTLDKVTIDTYKSEALSDERTYSLIEKNPVMNGEWTVQPQISDSTKKTTLQDKSSFTALGMDGFVPMPVGTAGKSFGMTVAPGVFIDLGFVFDWGIIVAGVEGSVNYFSAKNSKETYMLDCPVSLKAEYMYVLEDLYFFGGIKAGATIVNSKTIFDKDSQTGLSFYMSPEVGAGYCIAGCLALSAVTSFDMTMFVTGDIHMNLNPSIRLMYLF
jgi:hypothetical protein